MILEEKAVKEMLYQVVGRGTRMVYPWFDYCTLFNKTALVIMVTAISLRIRVALFQVRIRREIFKLLIIQDKAHSSTKEK